MSIRKRETTKYAVRGRVSLEDPTPESKTIKMMITATVGRRIVGTAAVNQEGEFTLTFEREGPLSSPLVLTVGPREPMGGSARVGIKRIEVLPNQWKEKGSFSSVIDILVEKKYWVCWKTRDITIRGIVCKEMPISGTTLTRCCPVPYAEVEVFDVDPLLYVVKAEPIAKAELVIPEEKKYKISREIWPPPPPPPPIMAMIPREAIRLRRRAMSDIMNPEESNSTPMEIRAANVGVTSRIGSIKVGPIGSTIPFYTKQSLGKTNTDVCGEFEITIKWPDCPSLVDDESPDLIFKVSQTVGPPGSPTTTTLVSEGYHETRWDVPDYVYVELDAAEGVFVACNPDCAPFAERRVYFMGIGWQVIEDHIIQPGDAEGRPTGYVYNGSFYKSPFGEKLKVRAKFGTKIEEVGERYYKISYAPVPSGGGEPSASDWQPISEVLTDTCFYSEVVPGVGLVLNHKEVALGPLSLAGSQMIYYEIRNQQDDKGHDLGWVDENKIAIWDTTKVPDGLYVLKIEVVMPDGNPDPAVHYGDDLGKYARMYAMVNNKKPHTEIKQVKNGGLEIDKECGSFAHEVKSPREAVEFLVDAYHEDDHLLYWKMTYQIGYGSAKGTIDEDQSGYTVGDFHGKENELVDWTYFDADFGWVADTRPSPPPKPAHDCTTFGVSVQLAVHDKVTDGEDFLGSAYGHYKEVHAGLAVSHFVTEGVAP